MKVLEGGILGEYSGLVMSDWTLDLMKGPFPQGLRSKRRAAPPCTHYSIASPSLSDCVPWGSLQFPQLHRVPHL